MYNDLFVVTYTGENRYGIVHRRGRRRLLLSRGRVVERRGGIRLHGDVMNTYVNGIFAFAVNASRKYVSHKFALCEFCYDGRTLLRVGWLSPLHFGGFEKRGIEKN